MKSTASVYESLLHGYLHVRVVRPPRCVLSGLVSLLPVRGGGLRRCGWMRAAAAVPFLISVYV